MFGGSKPSFGTTAPSTGFGGFNQPATASPFGQSAFGKPATSAFGQASTFGAQQTTPSLFGATAGQTQAPSLFGTANTSTAFGATTAAQPAFGSFSQPQQNTSIFGAAQPTATNTSLFGQQTTSAFGTTIKPGGLGGFGQTAPQQTSSLFAAPISTSAFGTFAQTNTVTTNVFGSPTSAFGQPNAAGANAGTSIAKYQPTIGTDTLMKGGQANNVNTKQHCITAMKEYESKSLEELRLEDYTANRKGPQAGTSTTGGFFGTATQPNAGTGMFGTTTQQTTGLFGQPAGGTENKPLFGATAFGQTNTSGFGANTQQQNNFLAKPFGQTTTTGFGAPAQDAAANPFGQKPTFGQPAAPSLFGQNPATSTAPAFGQTGFGGFGTAQQQPSMFGNTSTDANKPTFGLGGTSTANTGFTGFGTTATSTAGGGLFGQKPNTGFGGNTGFGATSTANTGFSNFTLNNTGGSLFNNKPATTGFGAFGTQTSTAPLNFNAGSNSLFGNTANKPMFGNTLGTQQNTTSGGLFGGGGFGGGTTLGGGFGGTGLGANNSMMASLQQQQQVPIHQQILSKVTSPYGDNPIFKDLKRNDETDASRATNPAAQKAILESSMSQFKITPKSSSTTIKVKPVGSALSKKSLFEGLEEFDSSVESFSLKPNGKRLVLTPKPSGSMIGTSGSISNQTPATTPQKQPNSPAYGAASNTSARNESFTGEIPTGSPAIQMPPKDNETSRRESWLHPNNLENMRQHNLNAGVETGSPLNSTLSELVPRKPLETYRPGTAAARLSVSTVPENPFEDQASLSRRDTVSYNETSHTDSLFANRTFGTDEKSEELQAEYEEHPTGITLKRIGYYTIPSMDDLKSYLAEDGSCVVPNFTVGREGYGNVYFGKEMDVAGLNLDEIVHFRNKEVIIYPDDDKKPPIGEGLNREAQVTLDQVWPIDKTKHEAIKDPQRLAEMEWEAKLRRVCDKNDTRFIEYRPETGSWVFRVKHFSKYGLTESDDEDDTAPADPKKAKIGVPPLTMAGKPKEGMGQVDNITMAALKNAQKISEDAARALDPRALAAGLTGNFGMDESAEFMFMDKTQFYHNTGNDFTMYDPRMQNAGPTSPTAALAKDAGTDSYKLQLMKASFFLEDERDGGMITSEFEQQRDSNRNFPTGMMASTTWKDPHALTRGFPSGASSQIDFGLQTPPVPIASSSASVMSVLREEATEASSSGAGSTIAVATTRKPLSKLPPFIVRPKVAQVKSLAVTVPFIKSIAHPWKLQWVYDLGLYNCRRFKMCFGPQNTLIVPTTSNNMVRNINNENLHDVTKDIFKPRGKHDFSATVLQHVQINSVQHYDNFKRTIVEHLDIQLRHSLQEDIEGTECPWIKADGGTELIAAHLEAAIKLLNFGPLEEYAVSVWSLCLTLWGDHDEMEGQDPSSHAVVMCRRNLLSQWLENAVTEKDLLNRNVTKHTYLDQLLELVMCHKVAEACELAFKYDDGNLALLLSQLSSGPTVRQLMEDQLAAWNKDNADKFIQLERLKLFMLVAGVSLMTSSHGPINTVESLEWIKVLALQLWYLSSPTASITDALLAYEKSFKSEEFYSTPPTPCYPEKYSLKIKSPEMLYDLRYHLLQLFSKRSHPMGPLLNPATHTADPLDFRLSWLMLQTLEALGYRHCSPLCEEQLHTGLAAQLENYELWEWSIFVLLHLKDRNQRELAVQNVLYRYVSVSCDVALTEKEKFVINNLGVPEKWIDYAKAVRAGVVGKHHIQAKYLLRAKQWHLAHDVIFQHIAPDAIINENLDYLYDLLSQFESPNVNSNVKVPNWSNQGQIFLDYIDIKQKFKGLKTLQTDADIETRWENLKPQLSDLCSRINLLPCPTPKHRLSQSEIAQSLACLLRGVLLVCPVINPCVTIKMALEKLPLPQEFAQQELRVLLDTTMATLTKEMLWVS